MHTVELDLRGSLQDLYCEKTSQQQQRQASQYLRDTSSVLVITTDTDAFQMS